MKKLFLLFLSFFLVIPQLSLSYAAEFLSGDTVYIPQEKVVDGSLFAAGDSIRIEGNVDGDVFCAGKDVHITGNVTGDILCAGQNVSVLGTIQGNVRVAGQTVDIQSHIDKNLTALSQSLTVDIESSVGKDAAIASQKARVLGKIGRDLIGGGETLTINGLVGKDVLLGSDSLTVGPNASIGGNIVYSSDREATIASGAAIAGTTTKKSIVPEKESPKRPVVQRSDDRPKGISFIISSLLFGLLLIFFLNKKTNQLVLSMYGDPRDTLLRGILVTLITPVVLLLFIITLIGIPFAFILAMVVIIAYVIGRVLMAIVVGRYILLRLRDGKKDVMVANLIIGIMVIWAIELIPFFGGLLGLVLSVYGLGGITYLFSSSKKSVHTT